MNPHRLILLGAGFSRHAGLPLGSELMALLLAEAKKDPEAYFHVSRDLSYFLELECARLGRKIRAEAIDLERFFGWLDTEFALRMLGGDTWSDEGNKSQIQIKLFLARILLKHQRNATAASLRRYDAFARRLAPSDWVMTFNYDTLLEDALDRVGAPYRLCPLRYESVSSDGSGIVNSKSDEIVIIKLHGSLDWFVAPNPGDLWVGRIFRDPATYQVEPLVGDPYPNHSYLTKLVRARAVDKHLLESPGYRPTPYILAPSIAKALYLRDLFEFWEGFRNAGAMNSQMAIIGFSFPQQDDYILYPLINAIRNFQQHWQLASWFGRTQLRFVGFQPNKRAIKTEQRRLCFVDWKKTVSFWGGFEGVSASALLPKSRFKKKWQEISDDLPHSVSQVSSPG